VEVPGALLDQGRLIGRLRSLLGVVEEARTRWRRRRRRWLVALVGLCLVSLVASLVVAFGPLSGGQGPVTSSEATRDCAGGASACGNQQADSAAAMAGGRWESISPGPLSARHGQTAVWTGRQLLVWGGLHQGIGSATSSQALGDGAAYDPTTGTWKTLPKSPLSPRAGSAGVWTGAEAIFWGGYAPTADGDFYSDGAAYDPSTGRWRWLSPSPLSPREGASVFWTGTEMLVFGGSQANDKTLDDGAVYRPSTNSWSRLPALPPVPGATLVGATVVWTGRQLLVWPTYEVISYPSPDSVSTRATQRSFAWTPGTSSWRQLPNPPSDVFTYGAHAVWTGRQALFVGGSDCLPGESCAALVYGIPLATYDPTTATWGSAPGNLVATHSGPVVWTGRALVALNQGAAETGPSGPILAPGDGAVFDPGRDRWQTLSDSKLGPLDEASAVWTGKEVLVWGSGTSSVANQAAVLLPKGRAATSS
jgi:hypothetical protein